MRSLSLESKAQEDPQVIVDRKKRLDSGKLSEMDAAKERVRAFLDKHPDQLRSVRRVGPGTLPRLCIARLKAGALAENHKKLEDGLYHGTLRRGTPCGLRMRGGRAGRGSPHPADH
jgi:hypothetical protein